LSHNLSSLKRFFQTINPVLKVELGGRRNGIGRTFMDANLTPFAEFPVPFHLVFFLVIGPA
jgi:hypothetical protein